MADSSLRSGQFMTIRFKLQGMHSEVPYPLGRMSMQFDHQLFNELRLKFPEVPHAVVTNHMNMHNNDRNKCVQELNNESCKYMFGEFTSADSTGDNLGFQHLNINNVSPLVGRSQSEGAQISAGSASGPPSKVYQPGHMTYPSSQADNVPHTAPVQAADFMPFLASGNSPIPNIRCSNQPGAVKRHNIPVYHIQTSHPQASAPGPQYGYPPSTTDQQRSVHLPLHVNTHMVSNQAHLQKPLYVNTVNIDAQNSGAASAPNYPSQGPFTPTSNQGLHVAGSNTQYHSSSKTIFMPETPPYKSPQPSNANQPTAAFNDGPGMVYGAPKTSQNHFMALSSKSISPSNYRTDGTVRPRKVVTLTSAGPEGQSEVRYIYPPSDVDQSNPGLLTTHNNGLQPVQFVSQFYSPNTNNVPSPPNANPSSQTMASTYLHIPNYQPLQTLVPAEGHLLTNLDPEVGRIAQLPMQPVMSPSSSHSSLSSETSYMETRPRSNSAQEDAAYTQALRLHQKARLDKLKQEFDTHEHKLEQLKSEVSQMERNMGERKSSITRNDTLEQMSQLREENLQLRAGIGCMARELDLFNNGKTPLGITDPYEQQGFYNSMNTGQQGSVLAGLPRVAVQPRPIPPPPPVHRTSVTTAPPLPPPRPPSLTQQTSVHSPSPDTSTHPMNVVPPAPPAQPRSQSGDSEEGDQWSCGSCTFLNHPALDKCEQCEMPRKSIGRLHSGDLCYCHDH